MARPTRKSINELRGYRKSGRVGPDVAKAVDEALDRMERVVKRSSTAVAKFEARMDIPQSKWEEFGERAADQLQLNAIRFLMKNYKNSGLKKRTGKLEGAIQKSTLSFSFSGKTAKLTAHMPRGVDPYESVSKSGKTTESDFFEVAGALHNGAVIVQKRERDVYSTKEKTTVRRRESIIGEKAKRSLKKKMLKGKMSKKAEAAIQRGQKVKGGATVTEGYNFGVAAKSTDKSVSSAGGDQKVTVIRPKPFFMFTPSQSKKLSEMFLRLIFDMAKTHTGIGGHRKAG
jgi:hypothetical protein